MNGTTITLNRNKIVAALFALAVIFTPCVSLAQKPGQKTFASAQQASQALFQAIRTNDEATMSAILGAPRSEICNTNPAEDKSERAQFVEKYKEMRRLVTESNGKTILYIGAENWPFPFPLVSSKGVWHFDTAAGLREILFRQIGRGETAAIQECYELAQGHGPAMAAEQHAPILLNGYDFVKLTTGKSAAMAHGSAASQFVYVAYPDKYRSTGVMTFLVNRKGAVYAKDLGPNTAKRAKALTTNTRTNSTWTVEK